MIDLQEAGDGVQFTVRSAVPVAAVVVARADRLAALPRPDAAFTGTLSWNVDGRSQPVRVLDPALTGFEMVIASENNGAVENVSRQIPAATAIDESWHDRADYFADHAARRLGEPAWGLISATRACAPDPGPGA